MLIVCSSVLYYLHVRRASEADLQRSDPFLRGLETKNETRTETPAAQSVEIETPGFVNTPDEHTDTPISDKTKALPNETEILDITDASLPDDFVSEEAQVSEDGPVSPFGFGPYPEIPADYTARHGQTVWQYPGSLPRSNQRNIELIHRVMIASWNEGDTQFISATFENDKVYLQYPNTMYVRYTVHEGADGTVQRRIGEWTSGEHNQSAIDQILEGNIPTGVTLIDMDSEEVGIDPYTFLGLE